MNMCKYRAFRPAVIAAALTLSGGCGGGGFGESISVPRQQQATIDAPFTTTTQLRIPQEVSFNITGAQRHSTGSGRSESLATEDGTASCSATVGETGEAWAQFQLGHVIRNDSPEAIEAAILFDCEYDYAVSGRDLATPAARLLALKLYIQDSNKRMLRKEMLADHAGQQGASSRSGRESPSFNITMEPGLAYHLVLTGRIEVVAAEDRPPVEAQLEVKKLTIEIQPR